MGALQGADRTLLKDFFAPQRILYIDRHDLDLGEEQT